MEWVTDVPAQPGFYWAYEPENKQIMRDAVIVIVEVRLWVEIIEYLTMGHEFDYDTRLASHWLGPLEVPAPPDR